MPMTARNFLVVASIVTVVFYSCDPGIGVVIINKTNADKKIQVIYPPNFKFPGDPGDTHSGFMIRDSIKTFDLAERENYLHPIIIPRMAWDSVARTYSFTLKANHEAVVESRFLAGAPTFGQVFIIDHTDTVRLKNHGGDFIKRPKLSLGGSWTHTIKDNE